MTLTADQIKALRDLQQLWPDKRFVLIGAAALGCQLDRYWRETNDLDISIAISLEELPAGLDRLEGWTRDTGLEQRWIASTGTAVNLLPAGAGIVVDGQLTWPGSGRVMNMVGFRHALSASVPLEVGEGVRIHVAPVAVIALLKMVTYLDHPWERDRDLKDIGYLLDHYLDADENRRFTEPLIKLGLPYEHTAAFTLGADLAEIVDADELQWVQTFITKVQDDADPHQTQTRMVRGGPLRWLGQPQELNDLVEAFGLGLGLTES